jgi:hypothetical protein
LAASLVDNSNESKLFKMNGKSEANSGPFRIEIENSCSRFKQSH